MYLRPMPPLGVLKKNTYGKIKMNLILIKNPSKEDLSMIGRIIKPRARFSSLNQSLTPCLILVVRNLPLYTRLTISTSYTIAKRYSSGGGKKITEKVAKVMQESAASSHSPKPTSHISHSTSNSQHIAVQNRAAEPKSDSSQSKDNLPLTTIGSNEKFPSITDQLPPQQTTVGEYSHSRTETHVSPDLAPLLPHLTGNAPGFTTTPSSSSKSNSGFKKSNYAKASDDQQYQSNDKFTGARVSVSIFTESPTTEQMHVVVTNSNFDTAEIPFFGILTSSEGNTLTSQHNNVKLDDTKYDNSYTPASTRFPVQDDYGNQQPTQNRVIHDDFGFTQPSKDRGGQYYASFSETLIVNIEDVFIDQQATKFLRQSHVESELKASVSDSIKNNKTRQYEPTGATPEQIKMNQEKTKKNNERKIKETYEKQERIRKKLEERQKTKEGLRSEEPTNNKDEI
jgi:hypothetical protein